MGCSDVPIPVFVETNLGTRLVVPVSPDILANEFKRELERKHLCCFPEIGSIKVNALTVKHKSRFYHLSESLPLKYAFLGSKRAWFLQVDVHLLRIPCDTESIKCNDKKDQNLNVVSVKKRTKSKNHEIACSGEGPKQQPLIDETKRLSQFASKNNDLIEETLSETFSESISVSGIIKKYFSDYDEVASGSGFPYSGGRINSGNECIMNNGKCTKPEVGKRLLVASDSLGLTFSSNQKPAVSLCRGSNGQSRARKLEGVVRHLVFDITDEGAEQF